MLHAALVAGVVITSAVCVYLGPHARATWGEGGRSTVVAVAFVLAALAAAAVPTLLRRAGSRDEGMALAQWWPQTLPRVVAIWAVGDTVGLFGAIAYLLTGQSLVLLVTGVGLAVLVFTSPGRLQGR